MPSSSALAAQLIVANGVALAKMAGQADVRVCCLQHSHQASDRDSCASDEQEKSSG